MISSEITEECLILRGELLKNLREVEPDGNSVGGCVLFGDNLYIVGGASTLSVLDERPSLSKGIFRFDFVKKEWEEIKKMDKAKLMAKLFIRKEGNKSFLYILGGSDPISSNGDENNLLAEVLRYDFSNNELKKMESKGFEYDVMPFSGRIKEFTVASKTEEYYVFFFLSDMLGRVDQKGFIGFLRMKDFHFYMSSELQIEKNKTMSTPRLASPIVFAKNKCFMLYEDENKKGTVLHSCSIDEYFNNVVTKTQLNPPVWEAIKCSGCDPYKYFKSGMLETFLERYLVFLPYENHDRMDELLDVFGEDVQDPIQVDTMSIFILDLYSRLWKRFKVKVEGIECLRRQGFMFAPDHERMMLYFYGGDYDMSHLNFNPNSPDYKISSFKEKEKHFRDVFRLNLSHIFSEDGIQDMNERKQFLDECFQEDGIDVLGKENVFCVSIDQSNSLFGSKSFFLL